MSELAQLALDSSLPQEWAEELRNSNRVTLDAVAISQTTFKVWDVWEDNPGEYQLKVQIQGVCSGSYDLQDLPEDLATIKEQAGYFSVSGYVLVVDEELEETVVSAMQKFCQWTEANKGVKKPAGRPSLWVKASEHGVLQLVIEPYTNTKGEEVFAFNGWAHQGLTWCGDGIRTRPLTQRYLLLTKHEEVPPVAPPPTLTRR